MPTFFKSNVQEFQHLQKPGRFQRFWPEFLVGGLAVAGGILWARRSVSRQDVERSLERLQRSAAEFISEHVTEPAEALYREVFLDQYIEVTDPAEVEDAKLSLQRCLREYLVQKELKSLGEISIFFFFLVLWCFDGVALAAFLLLALPYNSLTLQNEWPTLYLSPASSHTVIITYNNVTSQTKAQLLACSAQEKNRICPCPSAWRSTKRLGR